ncbi:MAG: hypothetical protein QMD36_03755 [Candidatus Aenigmarchaeota archaeon]|nr:hypothetical protein [Candidatus Aenigmarchaeota archaeon]
MKRVVIILLLVIILSFLLGVVVSRVAFGPNTTARGEITDFSVETRAICEEVKNSTCYYKCHDEVFLILAGKEISIHKNEEYVCHEEGWVDPRTKK